MHRQTPKCETNAECCLDKGSTGREEYRAPGVRYSGGGVKPPPPAPLPMPVTSTIAQSGCTGAQHVRVGTRSSLSTRDAGQRLGQDLRPPMKTVLSPVPSFLHTFRNRAGTPGVRTRPLFKDPRGGGGGCLGPGQPRPPPPPPHISKMYLRQNMKVIKGARNLRPTFGTQTVFWPLDPPPLPSPTREGVWSPSAIPS